MIAGLRLFEEIYKIKEHDERLQRSILGTVNINSQKLDLSGLKRFIWKRRSNLFGVTFKAITEIAPPYITHAKKSRDSSKNKIVYPKLKHQMVGPKSTKFNMF